MPKTCYFHSFYFRPAFFIQVSDICLILLKHTSDTYVSYIYIYRERERERGGGLTIKVGLIQQNAIQ